MLWTWGPSVHRCRSRNPPWGVADLSFLSLSLSSYPTLQPFICEGRSAALAAAHVPPLFAALLVAALREGPEGSPCRLGLCPASTSAAPAAEFLQLVLAPVLLAQPLGEA